MKKIKFLNAMLFCLMSATPALWAETTDISDYKYVLYVDPMEVKTGATDVTLSVNMKNFQEAQGFSFGISLPESFSFAQTKDGELYIEQSTVRTNGDFFDIFKPTLQPDGSVKVIAATQDNDITISGNDGEVVKVHIQLPSNIHPGTYTVKILEPMVTLTTGRPARQEAEVVETDIEITDGIGDVMGTESPAKRQYNLAGQCVSKNHKGVNVVQQSNGTTRKVLIK